MFFFASRAGKISRYFHGEHFLPIMTWEFLGSCLARIKTDLRTTLLPSRLRRLRPGTDDIHTVIASLGPATHTWKTGSGSVMEYTTMPFGTRNFMLDFDRNGTLVVIRNALTTANFARICIGMDREDVLSMLGSPAHTIHFPLKHEEVWDWKIDDDAGEACFFNVHFDDDGQVCATSRNREPRG